MKDPLYYLYFEDINTTKKFHMHIYNKISCEYLDLVYIFYSHILLFNYTLKLKHFLICVTILLLLMKQ